MLHPATRLCWISDAIGYGVRATRFIPKGTILWALDPLDRVFDPHDVARLPETLFSHLETYSYVNGQGRRVLCWDHARFMNHSCAPVSLSPGTEFELAVRDIEEGEELTCDYGSLNLEWDLHCLCGTPSCRGVIRSGDFAELAPIWDERLRAAVARAASVDQPLACWLDDPHILSRWAEQPDELPSAIGHYYPGRDAVAARRAASAW